MIGATIWAMYGIPLGTYDGSYIVSPEVSTVGTIYGKFKGFLLQDRLVSVVGLDIGKVIGTTIGVIDRLILGMYVGMEIGLSECFTDGTKDDKAQLFVATILNWIYRYT